MNTKHIVIVVVWLMVAASIALGAVEATMSIIPAEPRSPLELLAAKEVRRYLYLRTGQGLALVETERGRSRAAGGVVVGRKDRSLLESFVAGDAKLKAAIAALGPQQYLLRTIEHKDHKYVLIVGGDEVGTLYGAYRFAEHLGVRFYLHGDVVPDERMPLELPALDETRRPLFELRGIQPFHDFPEGPDWWNLNDYKAILSQLPKLGMNFFGLHTYPEGPVGPEPTVWIGTAEDVDAQGAVRFSYPARHFTTKNGTWGYQPKNTSDYWFGTAALFDRDDYGAEYMKGRSPWPGDPQACNDLFNEFGGVLREAFRHARSLGIKTCVGTETPLIVPKEVQRRLQAAGKNSDDPAVVQLLYEGVFSRISRAYPIDYYWFWTPETWTWEGAKDEDVAKTLEDLKAAIAAAKKVDVKFGLATCGWVLGPPQDRALFDAQLPKEIAVSCINRQVGKEPVEPGFARVSGRGKWAIPWLEDDPNLICPQLWVGRMRRDAMDARRYGCTGLMGIHWRTRILGPNVAALAQAAWEQADLPAATTQPRHLPSDDFYADWATCEFGKKAGQKAAAVFAKLDGRFPEPSTWVNGPGGIKPDPRPWTQAAAEYDFVDEFAAISPLVEGGGARERFDYWLGNFRYMRAIARLKCAWGAFEQAMQKIEAEKDTDTRRQLALQLALPSRKEIVQRLAEVYEHLIATITTTGEMGTLANWEQHIQPMLLAEPGKRLEQALGEPLPAEAVTPTTRAAVTLPVGTRPAAMPPASTRAASVYDGPPRLVVPTVRTNLTEGEPLELRFMVLTSGHVVRSAFLWRPIGAKEFTRLMPAHKGRGLYTVTLGADQIGRNDLEYYVELTVSTGQVLRFPSTAPSMNQTVVIAPRSN